MNAPTISAHHFQVYNGIESIFSSVKEKVAESKPKNQSSNEDLIKGLKERNNDTIKYIYKVSYPQIRFYITSNSGTIMDAEDVFQDALVLLYQKIAGGNFVLSCSFNTFIYSICRHLWLQRLNKASKVSELNELVLNKYCEDSQDLEEKIEESEKYSLFHKHFLKLKKDEQKVLNLHISKTPAREIASIMGYKSDKYAKFRKYLCKEKLKNMIVNDDQFQKFYQTA